MQHLKMKSVSSCYCILSKYVFKFIYISETRCEVNGDKVLDGSHFILANQKLYLLFCVYNFTIVIKYWKTLTLVFLSVLYKKESVKEGIYKKQMKNNSEMFEG